MKKLTLITLAFIVSVDAFAQKSNYKVFPFKSAKIEYKMEGKTTGTITEYIDDYGYKQAEYSNTVVKMFGHKTETNDVKIQIGPEVYSYTQNETTATKTKNPVYEIYANSEGKDYEELGEEAMASLGFTNTGETGTVLGKTCEIWKGPLGEIWAWKNLSLKSTVKVLGMKTTQTAVSIDLNASIPAVKFKVPDQIRVEETEVPEGMEGALKGIFGGK